jgi:L-ribulose-5-phosphate 3-epimerase UlaE
VLFLNLGRPVRTARDVAPARWADDLISNIGHCCWDILGPHVRSVHAKDGKWPTDPSKLGDEVLIGQGLVDFRKVFTKLHEFGYTGSITIERETFGPTAD